MPASIFADTRKAINMHALTLWRHPLPGLLDDVVRATSAIRYDSLRKSMPHCPTYKVSASMATQMCIHDKGSSFKHNSVGFELPYTVEVEISPAPE